MRKLTDQEHQLLQMIANVGGSYVPDDGLDPAAWRLLHDLVQKKRLKAESFDGIARFTLTAEGKSEVDHA